ncbi:MAG TPA: hypothetical protein VFE90_00860, partial [Myxococcales bacterium]|nr:hypothetical protein [Myxococcales bacterium]
MRELLTSAGAAARLRRAGEWLRARGRSERTLVVAATHEAASETVRDAARLTGGSFGWQRFTLGRLAAA